MYRAGKEYNEIDKVICQIYLDYDLRFFPIDEKEVCRKLGVSLIAYSEFDGADLKLLKKNHSKAFL